MVFPLVFFTCDFIPASPIPQRLQGLAIVCIAGRRWDRGQAAGPCDALGSNSLAEL